MHERLKRLECPNCGGLLMYQNSHRKTTVKIANANDEEGDYYPKCPKCKKTCEVKKVG